MTRIYIIIFIVLIFILTPLIASAHVSDCHGSHSCPPDSKLSGIRSSYGAYVCGDLGYCSECPDNRYCKNGKAREETTTPSALPGAPAMESVPLSVETEAFVLKAVSVDTLELRRGDRVRLIGVKAPVASGDEAYEYTKKTVEGSKVRLGFDRRVRDSDGMLIAYVYTEDGTFLNAELIKKGYARAFTIFPFSHLKEFRQYEAEARDNKIGIWRGD